MTVKQYQRRYIAEHVTDSELPEWFVDREDYEQLREMLAKVLPYAEEQIKAELYGGGCGPGMDEDLALLDKAEELLK